MDAIGLDMYGLHEGREEMAPNDEREPSGPKLTERLNSAVQTFFSDSTRSSRDRRRSNEYRRTYARGVGANDFHFFNPDASGFVEEESSSSSSNDVSRASTVSTNDKEKSNDFGNVAEARSREVEESSVDTPTGGDDETDGGTFPTSVVLASSSSSSGAEEADMNFFSGREDVVQNETSDEISIMKRVAVIGRDFDEPLKVARSLQKDCRREEIEFVSMVILRHELLSTECLRYVDGKNFDVIVLCYNTSEARILLTRVDGFYRILLDYAKHRTGKKQTYNFFKRWEIISYLLFSLPKVWIICSLF